jgi:hypothetical protein
MRAGLGRSLRPFCRFRARPDQVLVAGKSKPEGMGVLTVLGHSPLRAQLHRTHKRTSGVAPDLWHVQVDGGLFFFVLRV